MAGVSRAVGHVNSNTMSQENFSHWQQLNWFSIKFSRFYQEQMQSWSSHGIQTMKNIQHTFSCFMLQQQCPQFIMYGQYFKLIIYIYVSGNENRKFLGNKCVFWYLNTKNKDNGIWWLQPFSHMVILEWAGIGRSYAEDSCGFEVWSNTSISERMFARSISQLLFPSKETFTSLPLFAD